MLAPSAPSHTTTFQSAYRATVCVRGVVLTRAKSLNAYTETTISAPPSAVSSTLKGSSRQGDSASARWRMRSSPRSRALRARPQCRPAASTRAASRVMRDRGGDEQRDVRLLRAVAVEDADRVTGEGFAIEVEGGLAAVAIGFQEHRVGGLAGALGDASARRPASSTTVAVSSATAVVTDPEGERHRRCAVASLRGMHEVGEEAIDRGRRRRRR